jgi:hypothetical protein
MSGQHFFNDPPTRNQETKGVALSPSERDAKIGESKASVWLDQNRPDEQMAWWPAEPQLMEGRLIRCFHRIGGEGPPPTSVFGRKWPQQ